MSQVDLINRVIPLDHRHRSMPCDGCDPEVVDARLALVITVWWRLWKRRVLYPCSFAGPRQGMSGRSRIIPWSYLPLARLPGVEMSQVYEQLRYLVADFSKVVNV